MSKSSIQFWCNRGGGEKGVVLFYAGKVFQGVVIEIQSIAGG